MVLMIFYWLMFYQTDLFMNLNHTAQHTHKFIDSKLLQVQLQVNKKSHARCAVGQNVQR